MSKAVDSILLHIRHSTCEADNVSPWSPPSQDAGFHEGFTRTFSHLYLELLPFCPPHLMIFQLLYYYFFNVLK